ncbi:hypothetical protein CHS0354_022593 [Potamilus streckersoni]|uniref:Rab-GAP TBC domain-containing protein n=1 Tax=Potamilus streckersoni TaxID=2493646 RepID=A0AAE0W1S0_9BIVA|nr:hypothetical protein CHS0354_022593 [Potamilus streckersoni]
MAEVGTPDPPSTTQEEEDDSAIPPNEQELLAKLLEANRLLEADEKSWTPGHSRKGSETGSIKSNTSTNSGVSTQEEVAATSAGNLWDIWGKLVNDWDSAKKKPAFLKQLVRRGIPHHFRGMAWQLLLNVQDSPMKAMYVEYLKQTSPSEKMIRRDIARTFPGHKFFKEKDGLGQESLFNVMKAYSLHDREVGYCQGSGFIVGLLLIQMPEEETFAVLVKLMQDFRLRELFKPSMAELGLCMFKLECLIQDFLPDVYLHFQTQSFHTSMYASSWFLTLFATVFPLEIASRIMDLFISEGMDIIFRVAIAILQSSQELILSLDMEGMLQFFQKELPQKYDADSEKLFLAAFQVRYSAKKMKRLDKEYTALKSKENEDQIELRRLRTENRLLRQRIENLEKESADLADRLIQDQITRAQEAEETYALKNQLSTIRQQLANTQKKLLEAQSLIGDIKERTNSINSASSLDENEAQTVIQTLQEELIMVRLREAENQSHIKQLQSKIEELNDFNKQLQRAPSNDVQCLQEELIAVKLREAEANLSMKEMRQKVSDLESSWEKYMKAQSHESLPKEKSSQKEKVPKQELKAAQEELMMVKLREASCLSDLKAVKQKLMELETQNHICTNQIRRMDEENKSLKSKLEACHEREKDLQSHVKDLLRKLDDAESKTKEDLMMAKIKEAEDAQLIGELKQKIAQLEIQKQELLTTDELEAKDGTQDLENRIFDLQDEVFQLKMSISPKLSNIYNTQKDEDDDEYDDDIEDPESLNRTLTEIIEGKRSSMNLIDLLDKDSDASENCSHNSLQKDAVETTFVSILQEEQSANVTIKLTNPEGNNGNLCLDSSAIDSPVKKSSSSDELNSKSSKTLCSSDKEIDENGCSSNKLESQSSDTLCSSETVNLNPGHISTPEKMCSEKQEIETRRTAMNGSIVDIEIYKESRI